MLAVELSKVIFPPILRFVSNLRFLVIIAPEDRVKVFEPLIETSPELAIFAVVEVTDKSLFTVIVPCLNSFK